MPETVNELMRAITNLPTEPAVFRVSLSAAGYLSDYSATVIFRGDHEQQVSTRGATPEEALRNAHDLLIEKHMSINALRERCDKLEAALRRVYDNGYLDGVAGFVVREAEDALNVHPSLRIPTPLGL